MSRQRPAPEGIVFDMDGVLLDSERAWAAREVEFAEKIAPDWWARRHGELIGLRLGDLYQLFVDRYGATLAWEEFKAHYDRVGAVVYREEAEPFAGVGEVLAAAGARGLALGLASSSPRAWIDTALDRFGWRAHFDATVSGEEVPRGKPAPDVYREATRRLNIAPWRAWAVEDADVGLQAARKAGLWTVGFRHGSNPAQRFSEADDVVEAMPEVLTLLEDASAST